MCFKTNLEQLLIKVRFEYSGIKISLEFRLDAWERITDLGPPEELTRKQINNFLLDLILRDSNVNGKRCKLVTMFVTQSCK